MYQSIFDAIAAELNTGRCLRDIANHWACRCTVPGPGLRRAGRLLVERYRENGAEGAEMIPYPADDRTEYLDGRRNPLEWRPRDASLAVLAPAASAGVICRYADEPLCLVSNSTGTPPGGVRAEVVACMGRLLPEAVAEGEFAGKLLFTDQPSGTVQAAAAKGGAVGVISDCVSPPWLASYPPVREPEDAPDLVMWTIFRGRRGDAPLLGFNLSARQGRRLRQLIARSPDPVILHAVVDAELVEGSSDFVHAALPGTDLADEEVWVLAHLSEPGARDNASGCCLSLELARTLAVLIASGRLPRLRRTIRFLHAVEVDGFLPYLHANRQRLPKIVAGLCLDSVGQDFARCGGEMVLFRSPEQAPSFVDALMEALFGAAAAAPASRFGADPYAGFPWHTAPFWGNDAFISDGFFDIPTPQLSGWPDRYYHSSQDTPDQMSPATLGRVGAAAGTFLYLLAAAGAREARWLGVLAAQDWKRRIATAVADAATAAMAPAADSDRVSQARSLVRHLGLQGHDAILQAGRFAPADGVLQAHLGGLAQEMLAFADREALHVGAVLAVEAGAIRPETAAPAPRADGEALVARRLRWGVPPMETLSAAGRDRLARLAASADGRSELARVWRWIDGRRSARDIHERLRHGGEIPLPAVVACLRLLADEGLIEVREPAGRDARA